MHLNYDDPYLSPFDEFQRFKTHPSIRTLFEGGKRLAYGARAITEGGYQSVPRLTFAGGALIGCAAGFVNVPRIKGVHNAMGSGMLRRRAVVAGARRRPRQRRTRSTTKMHGAIPPSARTCTGSATSSRCGRSSAPSSGVALGGIDMWCNTLGFSLFGTQSHAKPDRKTLDPAQGARRRSLSPSRTASSRFDKLSSVFLSNTNHEEDQPVHLKVADMNLQKTSSTTSMPGRPTAIARPASMNGSRRRTGPRFQINAQNCVHCKTCDVKDPERQHHLGSAGGGGGSGHECHDCERSDAERTIT